MGVCRREFLGILRSHDWPVVALGLERFECAASYLVLCIRFGYRLPGTRTIPDQISDDKTPYYGALEAADLRWKDSGRVDLSAMEDLLSTMLARQLFGVLSDATGYESRQ